MDTQVSVGRREQRQARLIHAYCSHGAVVAPSVDEGLCAAAHNRSYVLRPVMFWTRFGCRVFPCSGRFGVVRRRA